jgi:membrane-associated phospholipid phosphatase
MLLNHLSLEHRHELPRTPILDELPILPWTVLPYVSAYGLVGAAILLLPDRASLRRYFRASLAVMTITFLIFLALPTRMGRPPLPPGDSLWLWGLELTRSLDAPHTCFPSLHIANCVLPVLAVWGTRAASVLLPWALAIAASTLTTGQHVFVDLPAGALVGYAGWWWASARDSQLQPGLLHSGCSSSKSSSPQRNGPGGAGSSPPR